MGAGTMIRVRGAAYSGRDAGRATLRGLRGILTIQLPAAVV